MKKPWLAIIWFALWGLFQTFAVFSVTSGNWERPEAFPEEAYYALIYPDMVFIPLYFLASFFLFQERRLGLIIGLVSGGGVVYVMIYLLALSGLEGMENLIFDSLFLTINVIAVGQLIKRMGSSSPDTPRATV
ncbi:MAG: hypothetical protein ACE5GK_00015 [Nitrospiria bacterium]